MNEQTAEGMARSAAAATGEAAPGDDARLWGIGQFVEGGRRVPYPVSAADIEADTLAAGRALGSLAIGRGHTVLFVSLVSEIVQMVPFHDALGRLGGVCSAADATPFDASRTAKLVRQLHPRAVLGVNVDVLDGLEEGGFDLADAFLGVPVVGAHPAAAARLEGAGLAPRIWAFLGPAVGVECEPGAGAHIDEAIWIVDDEDGELVVAPRAERAIGPGPFRTGVPGSVARERCGCGRADARVRIALDAD